MIRKLHYILLVLFVFTFAATTTAATKFNEINSVKLIQASAELSTTELLDIDLAIFEPGVPTDVEKQAEQNIYPQVREAEARYIPYVLRATIERSNLWGAVRMTPGQNPLSEVVINGKILHSDGTELQVSVSVSDATGKHWYERTYSDEASKFNYRPDLGIPGDPFQDLYHQIANDIYAYRSKLSEEELRRIRDIANLRYAAEISPDAFGQHLKVDKKGRFSINRLPSDSDPMMARVSRIKESEYLFIDTVDQQYGQFFYNMDPSYSSWRRFSFEEVIAEKELKASSRRRMLAGAATVVGGAVLSSKSNSRMGDSLGQAVAVGGLSAIKQGYDVGKQAKIHEDALQELAASFNAEVEPIVMEVEGEVVKLTGTLDAQYQNWRQLLRQIYAEEVGLPVAQEPSNEMGGAGVN